MDAREYWQRRAQENELKVYRYAQRRAQLVTRWFGRTRRDMQKKITDFYRQYAEGEGISLQAAKKAITDRRVLAVTREEAERLARLYPQDQEISSLLRKGNFSRAISREEFLKMQLQLLATEVHGQYAEGAHQSLTQVFEECYYKTLFDYQQFVGFGSSFNRISTHRIEAAVNMAWQGKHYSERIWRDHRKTLARYLDRIVTTGVAQGKPLAQMEAQLRQAMDASAYNARRLIRTECTAVAGRGSLAAYQENGTEQFEFVATLDNRTSELCRSMDGKLFYTKDVKIGVNMPPLHPFCRSTTVPYIPDPDFDWDDTRTARSGATGRTYKVPAEMTYRQWYDKYVKTDPAELLAEQKLKNGAADAEQFERYTTQLGKDMPRSFDEFQNIKYTDGERYRYMELDYRRRSRLNQHPELALPNALQTTAAEDKFIRYLFNPDNPVGWAKGRAIEDRLGYSIDNWPKLKRDLLARSALYPAVLKATDQFGASYEQKVVIYGNKGTPANMVLAWKVKAEETRLVSAYIKEVD